mmetsp:Transcript_22048/g.52918  ORF Transcript_22048/g.52918 Transcript_22048/m.52918 type:complete len:230 (+) Transcript_22048:993-1682(+)
MLRQCLALDTPCGPEVAIATTATTFSKASFLLAASASSHLSSMPLFACCIATSSQPASSSSLSSISSIPNAWLSFPLAADCLNLDDRISCPDSIATTASSLRSSSATLSHKKAVCACSTATWCKSLVLRANPRHLSSMGATCSCITFLSVSRRDLHTSTTSSVASSPLTAASAPVPLIPPARAALPNALPLLKSMRRVTKASTLTTRRTTYRMTAAARLVHRPVSSSTA